VNALNMNPERRIEVDWNQETVETYPVRLLIRSLDRVGLLADLASNINQNGANILSANTETRDNQLVDSYFTIAVENTLQLKKVIAAVRRVRLVQGVKRIEG
jgi:GTP pyrophosphokinase